ncbi:12886_t:CDS:2, partial [Gigaspora rosea]
IKQNSNWQVVYYSDAIDLESTDLSREYIAENKSKENHAYSVRGGGKRMLENVKGLLERFFLNGNLNVRDRMTAQEIHDELYKFVESGEINEEDIPKVSTIKGWIATYSRALKRNTTLLVIQQTSSN